MKVVFIVVTAMTVLIGYAVMLLVSERGATAQASASVNYAKRESPFYCDRLAIKPEQRARKEELGKILRLSKSGIRELADGYEFEFPVDPSTFQAVAEWAAMERLCCPFFEINLRLEREGGPFWLRLTGREGVKQFIKTEFPAEWFRE